ncbi:MAG: phosphoribosylformylglycinamidine synthase subunit PurS [Alphaproteobacteria bacterium]|nr:phosphoribosylformylglycinamidine synthase subunit PurS [Alphaproteobacteria bacterium]
MKARVRVTLKSGVLDPQGSAIAEALHRLGHANVANVRQGKFIELDLEEPDPTKAKAQVEAMCRDLFVNPVIETYAVEIS